MPSKQSSFEASLPEEAANGQLQRMARVMVEGPEASAFLQRQCTSDVRLLGVDGDMQWSLLLSAKGRVLHLFRLLRSAADRFFLLAADDDSQTLAQTLQRFVLRSKLQVTPQPGPLRAAIGPQPENGGPWLAWDAGRWIAADQAPGQSAPELDAAWQHLDTLRGIPRIDPALADRYTPQMLSLQTLQAFSLAKGCYPGQEIVARTHYLGQQKRALLRVEALRSLRVGEALQADGKQVGELIQVADRHPLLGLAVAAQVPAGAVLTLEDGSPLNAHSVSAEA